MLDEKFKKPYLFISILISVIIAQALIFFYTELESSSFKPPEDKSVVAIKLSSLSLPSKPETKPIKEFKEEPKKEPKEISKKELEPKPKAKPEQKPNPKPKIEQKPKIETKPMPKPKEISKKEPKEEAKKDINHKAEPRQNHKPIKDIKKEPTYKKEYISKLKSDYLFLVRKKIEENKFYPRSAKRLKQTGIVVVEFKIEKSGKITTIKITKPSEYKRLNRAAKKTLEKIDSFEPIPEELDYQELILKVPIKFMLNS